jgi:gamma-glutamyltranspeptidase/glutathione hydrolase
MSAAQVACSAPHAAAARIAVDCLEDGASAIDAMIAASAAISVAYPHMNSLGGDAFWLVQAPGENPVAIDACGFSAALATPDWYRHDGDGAVPARGGGAALCVGGTVDGWREARALARELGLPQRPLRELLAPAAALARDGVEVTQSLASASEKVHPALGGFDDYAAVFCPSGRPLTAGETLRNPGLARFLERLGEEGPESVYRGALAAELAAWLEAAGSPLRREDFAAYRARRVTPLAVPVAGARLYNLPAPTQGVASLLILAIHDAWRRGAGVPSEADTVHLLVEATKRAFAVRDAEVADPARLSPRWPALLGDSAIADHLAALDLQRASPWPRPAEAGDTVWLGAVDAGGCLVSFIQSIYWEFGSGLVHPDYGLVWNNRGLGFSTDPAHRNALAPRRRPRHTLNPALAVFDDGRRLAYGTMGGEGQPQTQAALFTRYHYGGVPLDAAIADGRWLLGRTWGDDSQDLKLEADIAARIGDELRRRGHALQEVPARSELMGHAGAVCVDGDGAVIAATDPRSDGAAAMAVARGGRRG